MDYTPYYETMRRTSLLRGMTDAELDTLMACFAPRVRRYAKGELLLMAGYETHEVGLVLEGAITASKPLNIHRFPNTIHAQAIALTNGTFPNAPGSMAITIPGIPLRFHQKSVLDPDLTRSSHRSRSWHGPKRRFFQGLWRT